MSESVQTITQQINAIYDKYMQEVQHEAASIDEKIAKLSQRKQFLLGRRQELAQLQEQLLQLADEIDTLEIQFRSAHEQKERLQQEIVELEQVLASKREELNQVEGSVERHQHTRREKYQQLSELVERFGDELVSRFPASLPMDEATSDDAPLQDSEREGAPPPADAGGQESQAEDEEALDDILAELGDIREENLDEEALDVDDDDITLVKEISNVLDSTKQPSSASHVDERLEEAKLEEELGLEELGVIDEHFAEEAEEEEVIDEQEALEELIRSLDASEEAEDTEDSSEK